MKKWKKEKPLYEKVNLYIQQKLNDELNKRNIRFKIQFRIKDDLSLRRKLLIKGYTEEQYDKISDKSGIRIICSYISDLDIIAEIISELFLVIKFDDKRATDEPNWIGYQAIHLDIKPKSADSDLKKQFLDLTTEIQIKTALQTAWGDNNHDLTYKNIVDIPIEIKRKINLLNAIIEVADNEFDKIYHDVKKIDLLSEFSLLFLLDDIFMKNFNLKYNVNFTYYFIRKFLDYYKKKFTTQDFENKLTIFVKDKYEIIMNVFKKIETLGEDKLFFKQPESILIYFSIVTDKFIFEDEWLKHFPIEVLETIATWFGEVIEIE